MTVMDARKLITVNQSYYSFTYHMKKKKMFVAGGLVTSLLFVGVSSVYADQKASGATQGIPLSRSRQEGDNSRLKPVLRDALRSVADKYHIKAGDIRHELASNPEVREALGDQGLSDAQIQRIIDTAPGKHFMKRNAKEAGSSKGFARGFGMHHGHAYAELMQARAESLDMSVSDLKLAFKEKKGWDAILSDQGFTKEQYRNNFIDELEKLVNTNGIDAQKKEFYTKLIKKLKAE
jgi:hypothetical protein